MLFLELVSRDNHEGKICGEHDGGYNCRRDGQHEGDDPGRRVEHTTRGDNRQGREKRQAGGNRVEHEQDGENFEDEARQFWLVRHDLDELWTDGVPELWANAIAVVTEKRRPVQRTGIRQWECKEDATKDWRTSETGGGAELGDAHLVAQNPQTPKRNSVPMLVAGWDGDGCPLICSR